VSEVASQDIPRASRGVWLRFGIAAVVIVAATAGAVATALLLEVKTVSDTLRQYGHVVRFRRGTITPSHPGKPETLLLVGSDRRYGEARTDARSDTLMLVRLDPHADATTLLSIPRDLRVQIPGHGTSKINAAYSEGGLDLTARTVKQLLSSPGHPFRINHVIGVNFSGFREAVDYIGCVYIDVDRRYYHSNLGVPLAQRYAAIDIQPGYQKLCGQQALDYARFRHLDNDIVRAARQQTMLRAAAQQVAASSLLGRLHPLTKIFAKATESDAELQSASAILRLIKLAAYSVGRPVRQIPFPATFVNDPASTVAATTGARVSGLGSYVTASDEQIRTVVHAFLHGSSHTATHSGTRSSTTHASSTRHRRASGPAAYGLVDARAADDTLLAGAPARPRVGFDLYLPRWLTANGQYAASTPVAPSPRVYSIVDRDGHRHRAYRVVVAENASLGQYYGIQGTTWTHPPLLDDPSERRRMAGRTYLLFYDAGHLRTVGWRTARAAYWVSNTLSMTLTNRQMLGIARSLRLRRTP
jgi:polyisoprenyl-teichoic acid--peptidoglycan teichoic acid transferase